MFVDSHLSGYELENEDESEYENGNEVYALLSLFIKYYYVLFQDKLSSLEEASLFFFKRCTLGCFIFSSISRKA